MSGKLNVGMLGLGTVGSGVPLLLKEHQEKIFKITGMEIELTTVFVRDTKTKEKISEPYHYTLTEQVDDVLLNPEIDVVLELIGGIEPAKSYIIKALEQGKHVVTANKDLIAQHGAYLVEIARKHHCNLYYEASVAGGIPILRTIANSLAADHIESIYGIVNGTTNFMLSKMMLDRLSYSEALDLAQGLGFAESDPTNDVEGIDAAYKMIILTQFSFGMSINMSHVRREGITGITTTDIEVADKLGYTIKLIGSSEKSGDSVSVDVGPVLVPKNHPLAGVQNEMNAVFIKSFGVGESMYYGPGAGAKPTATSVVSDLITIAKNVKLGTTGHVFNAFSEKTRLTRDEDTYSEYYFSVEVPDKQGVFMTLSQIMDSCGVSLKKIIQEKAEEQTAQVVIITHKMSRKQMLNVVEAFSKQESFKVLSQFKVL